MNPHSAQNSNKIEIERKFLLHKIPFNLDNYTQLEIEQAYVSVDPTIRLRRIGREFFLTVKQGLALVRTEVEFPITEQQYRHLWGKIETNVIRKTRILVPLDLLTAELDIYHGSLDGLMTVEVEFKSLEDALAFIPPNWFGEDVSQDPKYTNSMLALNDNIC
ncbi:MAG: CYTH domain-containing protein [Clostridiales bacterium]|jgi:CYTH domain-containing protein|nr:CYTH domain-containing protein [Clostridiales bacterium]